MKHSDFSIGMRFLTAVGLWICTDVGTRTIAAIRLPDDTEEEMMGATLEQWLQGPPYVLNETLFNERDIELAYVDWEQDLLGRLNDRHPGFLSEDMRRLMCSKGKRKHRSLLATERLRGDQLLHPYDLEGTGTKATVSVLEVFTRVWLTVPVAEFLALPVSTDVDVARLADLHGRPSRLPTA